MIRRIWNDDRDLMGEGWGRDVIRVGGLIVMAVVIATLSFAATMWVLSR